jgi:superfamily II DNA or RNA helicase
MPRVDKRACRPGPVCPATMLRLHLPPNLTAAIGRDAVPLKVELDLTTAPPAELFPALALLQRWCGTPTPPKFIQLTRAQLRELIAAAGPQPIFVENNQPARAWSHDFPLEPAKEPGPGLNEIKNRKSKIQNRFTPMVVDGTEHFLAITLPSREHPAYSEVLDLLRTSGFILEPSNRKWWLRDRHKTLTFLAAHGEALRHRFFVTFTPNFEKQTARLQAAELTCAATEDGAGFEVTLGLSAGPATESEIRSAVNTGRSYLETDRGIFLFEPAKLQQLAAVQRVLTGNEGNGPSGRLTRRVPAARAAELQPLLEEISPHFQPPAAWRARSEALRQFSKLPSAPLPTAFAAQLRPYQQLGTAWLWHLYRHELGGVLADEMGLGKTLQALGLLAALHTPQESPQASLVVAPASLLENWRREARRFVPELRVFIHHGEQRLASPAQALAHDLIITSYGTLTRDRELFGEIEFACVIADEAQHIKNRRSQNARALRALRSRGRFLLTGTPLENSLDDLRALFEFLMPGYIESVPPGTKPEDRSWFNDQLRARTAPYILRRTKQSVAPELPPRIEQTLWCEPTPAQAALYRQTLEQSERALLDLAAGGASEASLRLATLTQLLRLRQICCDPRLVAPAAPAADSAKLEAFRELLDEAVDDGHRVLVFSQFTSLLALLRSELDTQEVAYCYLDGAMPTKQRQAEVDRFQYSPDIPVFLLSLKAGGTGLNLTGADTVIHLDPWWNPAVEAQATDRAHRIGQTRTVTSYKLICSGTVEEKVLALQAEKRALLADVFEASDAVSSKLTLTDLRDLLKG